MFESALRAAANAIAGARSMVIAAGAGMGVDSGLPDFRGNEGFWKAYPPFRKLGLSFSQLANPQWFNSHPELAWGFYGHRLDLYRKTQPHEGFAILRRWAEEMPAGYFIFTSNIDGHFQKAGFSEERIYECHGSIELAQCLRGCSDEPWRIEWEPVINPDTFRAEPPLPCCPNCGALARPNVLMFGDFGWNETRATAQHRRYMQWLHETDDRMVIIEMGAGTAIPTVRIECERLPGKLIRINPRDPQAPKGAISIAGGALETLREIERLKAKR